MKRVLTLVLMFMAATVVTSASPTRHAPSLLLAAQHTTTAQPLAVEATNTSVGTNKWQLNIGLCADTWQGIGTILYRPDVVPGGSTSWAVNVPLALFGLQVEADYQLRPRLALYANLVAGYTSVKCRNNSGALLGTMHLSPMALTAGLKTIYYRGGYLNFYGRYGLGLCGLLCPKSYPPVSTPDWIWIESVIDIYPVCFATDGKWGGFLEFGFGSKGLTNAGIFFRF